MVVEDAKIYFAPPQIELFDGRLDDNNMKDTTTEMIPFASLRPCAFAFKSRTQRTKIAVYAGVEYRTAEAANRADGGTGGRNC